MTQTPSGRLNHIHRLQPSLTGLSSLLFTTQDYVLGYSQPSLRDSILQCLSGATPQQQTKAAARQRAAIDVLVLEPEFRWLKRPEEHR